MLAIVLVIAGNVLIGQGMSQLFGRCNDKRSPSTPPGAYIPTCTATGWFHAMQCHASTGQCWCVSPDGGLEYAGTRVKGIANCPKCLQARAEALPSINQPVGVPSGYIPVCDGNGKYDLLQYARSAGYSFCVNVETGEKIPNTQKPMSTHRYQDECTGSGSTGTTTAPRSGPCTPPPPGATPAPTGTFTPKCTNEGLYERRQCLPLFGYCWCVDPNTGEKIPGTEKKLSPAFRAVREVACESGVPRPSPQPAPVPADDGPCKRAARPANGVPLRCSKNGWFEVVQCNGNQQPNTFGCWCVDPRDGTEVGGTRIRLGDRGPFCGNCHKNILSLPQPRPGSYIPQCDKRGLYETRQCLPSSRYCWCADPNTGEKIPGTETRLHPGHRAVREVLCESGPHPVPRPQPQPATAPAPTTAPTRAPRPCTPPPPGATPAPPGKFTRKCTNEGQYERRQCWQLSGYCWCVDPNTGATIPGTAKGPGQGQVSCDVTTTAPTTPATTPPPQQPDNHPCATESKRLQAANSPPGTYIPTCTKTGWYNATQCHGSTGYCWCVFPPTGSELTGTRVPPGKGPPKCPKCLVAKAEALPGTGSPGNILTCDGNGKYFPLQFSGSYTFCVNVETGEKIPNTEKPPGPPRKPDECTGSGSTGTTTTSTSGPRPCTPPPPGATPAPPGKFTPKCTNEGLYERRQCWQSSGYCWCVDPNTGEKIPGTETGPATHRAVREAPCENGPHPVPRPQPQPTPRPAP